MLFFTRTLVAIALLFFVLVVFLSSSRGWWHATFRDSGVMQQNRQYNQAYREYYLHDGIRQDGIRQQRTRSFRSGTRGGLGK